MARSSTTSSAPRTPRTDSQGTQPSLGYAMLHFTSRSSFAQMDARDGCPRWAGDVRRSGLGWLGSASLPQNCASYRSLLQQLVARWFETWIAQMSFASGQGSSGASVWTGDWGRTRVTPLRHGALAGPTSGRAELSIQCTVHSIHCTVHARYTVPGI